MTLDELKAIVVFVDAHLDEMAGPEYQRQPLALDWLRTAKLGDEAGEAVDALARLTRGNSRKPPVSREDFLAEVGDVIMTGLLCLQHFTKDADAAWGIVAQAMRKCRDRARDAEARMEGHQNRN